MRDIRCCKNSPSLRWKIYQTLEPKIRTKSVAGVQNCPGFTTEKSFKNFSLQIVRLNRLLNPQVLRIQSCSLYPLFSFLANVFIKWEISAADILSIPGCILLEEKSLQALETWLQIICLPQQRRVAEKKLTLLASSTN